MVLPMLASLLPGLAAGAKRFVSGVASDLMAGKGLGQSLKQNAISTASSIIPGSGEIIRGAIGGVQKLIGGGKKRPAITGSRRSMAEMIQGKLGQVQRYGRMARGAHEALGAPGF